ncbi:MAG: hypothetical protein ABI828_08190, partial [Actinomycetota bacterium]
MFELRIDPPAQQAVAAAFAVLALAVAALGGVRYRGAKDPATLFVAVAFLILGANAAVLGVWWPRLHLDPGLGPAIGWVGGWLVAAVCLLLTRPWWDRRGRRAVRPIVAIAVAAATTALIDVVSFRSHPAGNSLFGHVLSFEAPSDYARPSGNGSVGGLGWMFVVLACLVMVIAGVRLIRQRRGGSVMLATATIIAALGLLSSAGKSTFATGAFAWVDVWPIVVAAFAFAALLVDLRVDTSRMRRATDRARAVMGGRAEIASMLGHEVKGPVATIRGLAATTMTHYDRLSDTERQEFL